MLITFLNDEFFWDFSFEWVDWLINFNGISILEVEESHSLYVHVYIFRLVVS